jgi:hypothetical protein
MEETYRQNGRQGRMPDVLLEKLIVAKIVKKLPTFN